jgi:hypothetical protein
LQQKALRRLKLKAQSLEEANIGDINSIMIAKSVIGTEQHVSLTEA